MIPRLHSPNDLNENYLTFLDELKSMAFSGEICTDYASRLIMATDNSVYQVLPQAVIYPSSHEDVVKVLTLLADDRFPDIKVSPRGGGTGTNGQSLSEGIMIDVSRHMTDILEINPEERWVRVQPGVVLDQLNNELKEHGLFFAPTLSTSNRATMGGMINTDACGKGSATYGKTCRHVQELRTVLYDGTTMNTKAVDLEELEQIKKKDDRIGEIFRVVEGIATKQQTLIDERLPKLDRFLTGYNLEKLYSEDRKEFNLNYVLTGSEGTLGVITEAKLKLTPIPKYKKLLLVKYRSFFDALEDAQVVMASEPSAIETIDERILELAKEDEIYYRAKNMLTDVRDIATRGINFVEFTGDDPAVLDEKIEALCEIIDNPEDDSSPAIGYYRAEKNQEMSTLWELRKKGVGLLGNAKGKRKPIAFVEDTAVPPQHLAAYIRDFCALLEENGLQYGMFGHVDVGCLHVRPALDMKNPSDEKLLIHISNQVVELVQKYGGVMWGEHGKGFRSEYGPQFFGEELFRELRKIKGVFDPENRLNPGKIVTPLNSDDAILPLKSPTRGQQDRQIHPHLQQKYAETINCNGNGACFNYNPDDLMCPSMKVTGDRIQSPKGRAAIMREWLRQLSGVKHVPGVSDKKKRKIPIWNGLQKVNHTLGKKFGRYDFSHEVYEAMAGCLSCKACATQCPIKVDVPDFKSRFLELYHSRYLRPLRDVLTVKLESFIDKQAGMSRLSNSISSLGFVQSMVRDVVGMVDIPCLSEFTVQQGLKERKAPKWNLLQMEALSEQQKAKSVILVQDAFTSFYEADVVLQVYDFLQHLGIRVYVMPFQQNGKAYHVKGFLKEFGKVAKKTAKHLTEAGKLNIPMIGIDPAIVLTYRDEYVKVLGEKNVKFKVQLLQEWLITRTDALRNGREKLARIKKESFRLFGHCTEKTAAPASQKQWEAIYEALGIDLKSESVGCCGMGGVFGHEAKHEQESRDIYALSWGRKIDKDEKVLVTGYSCRSQVKRIENFKPRHPVAALLEIFRSVTIKNPNQES